MASGIHVNALAQVCNLSGAGFFCLSSALSSLASKRPNLLEDLSVELSALNDAASTDLLAVQANLSQLSEKKKQVEELARPITDEMFLDLLTVRREQGTLPSLPFALPF